MLKKALSIALLGTCIAPSAFSASMFNLMGLHHKKHVMPANATKNLKKSLENYTDFSGNWTGTCTIGSGETLPEQDLTIENTAEWINMNGIIFNIGTFINFSESQDFWADDNHIMFTWNDNGQLSMEQVSLSRATIMPNSTYINTSKTTFTLVDGQLIINDTSTSLTDGETSSVSCQFSRVTAVK